jgi:hypothetical protein
MDEERGGGWPESDLSAAQVLRAAEARAPNRTGPPREERVPARLWVCAPPSY